MEHDIIFEVIPPSKYASEASISKLIDRIANVVLDIKKVTILNIPEIVEENHLGLPYYRNADNREFGVMLRNRCKKDIMLNTVVVHYNSKERFGQWLDETVTKYCIKNFVFVGAKINSMRYPGPSIIEANSIARGKNVSFGNIFIPDRENEVERLVSKTASGCTFFTSQVLYEPDPVISVIEAYSRKCEEADLIPSKFFLSFSPVSNAEDIAFAKWLGAEINKSTENRLATAKNIGEESIKIIIETLNKILDFFKETNIRVPLGLNIEYISLHNLELSKDSIDTLSNLKFPAFSLN